MLGWRSDGPSLVTSVVMIPSEQQQNRTKQGRGRGGRLFYGIERKSSDRKRKKKIREKNDSFDLCLFLSEILSFFQTSG
jgi:hypothetical protein